MKKASFIIALAMCCGLANAQEVTKPVVNVEAFTYNSDFSSAEANIVRNNVVNSLQGTKRVIVVDLQQQNLVNSEAERRKQEAAIGDSHEVADITQLNANFILRGALNTVTTTSQNYTTKDGKSYTSWSTSINYTIQLINPATGATENTYTYDCSGSSRDGSSASRDAAFKSTSVNMSKFVEEAFPVRGTILQAAEADAKKAKTVYINLGSDNGIQKGQKFIVYAVVDIAGERSEKEIGTLTAQEVMSATRTVCKVNDGGPEILQNLSSKSEMTIKSRAKKGFFADVF